MSTFSRQRKQRVRDFRRRAEISDDPRTYRTWRYEMVHPFADEGELLTRLAMQPSECREADVWWHTGRDMVLLQTVAVGEFKQATICFWFGRRPYLSIITRLPGQVVTIELLHEAMDRIAACGLPKRYSRAGHRVSTLFQW